MKNTEIEWSEESIEHIARHGVLPEEVEEVCRSSFQCKERGRGGFYYVTGQTHAGRYLFIVVRYLGHRKVKVITARDMDEKEKYRYKKRK
ncbi:MAG: BrnT family toxin [Chlamydiae bacterium]|nr:BrnT family toxin [Chlamydiota bacterium]MBI3265654.1 BrnT family toxin [Chlamydiota bacterium]